MDTLSNSFYGRVAVVTGGGGTLCATIADALAKAGAKIAVLDIDMQAAQGVADNICAKGGIAKAYQCDVIDRESVETCHQFVIQDLGLCDLLINGAGGNHPLATTSKEHYYLGDLESDVTTFFDLEEPNIDRVFALNYMGTLLPAKVFARDMLERPGCSILNIASINAVLPLTKIPVYSSAKAAVASLTKWLSVYFSKAGIRVNALAPGFFSTKQNKPLLWTENGTPTARTEKILQETPLGRFGEPEELIGPALFLLDNQAASFVTGVVLAADGGFTAYAGV